MEEEPEEEHQEESKERNQVSEVMKLKRKLFLEGVDQSAKLYAPERSRQGGLKNIIEVPADFGKIHFRHVMQMDAKWQGPAVRKGMWRQ